MVKHINQYSQSLPYDGKLVCVLAKIAMIWSHFLAFSFDTQFKTKYVTI